MGLVGEGVGDGVEVLIYHFLKKAFVNKCDVITVMWRFVCFVAAMTSGSSETLGSCKQKESGQVSTYSDLFVAYYAFR